MQVQTGNRMCVVIGLISMYTYIYIPRHSMYSAFTYIGLIFMVNVGKYTVHGCYGISIYRTSAIAMSFDCGFSNLRIFPLKMMVKLPKRQTKLYTTEKMNMEFIFSMTLLYLVPDGFW